MLDNKPGVASVPKLNLGHWVGSTEPGVLDGRFNGRRASEGKFRWSWDRWKAQSGDVRASLSFHEAHQQRWTFWGNVPEKRRSETSDEWKPEGLKAQLCWRGFWEKISSTSYLQMWAFPGEMRLAPGGTFVHYFIEYWGTHLQPRFRRLRHSSWSRLPS